MAAGQPEKQVPTNGGFGEGEPLPPREDVWDEEHLENALKTLKEMHIQARNLRTTIPRLIAPLATKQPSPEVLFQEFSKSMKVASGELHQFQQLMRDEDSVNVMDQAKKSRAERPKGIKPWKVIEHPDWLTRDA